MALLVLEIGVLGALGTLVLASETLRRAERLERATGRVEALLDSLGRGAAPDTVSFGVDDVNVAWTLDGRGRVEIVATDREGGLLVRARSTVRLR